MKHLKMQDFCGKNTKYSGVYKITFPNGKIYVGISNDIYRRMREHNYDFRNNLPIERAILKYGKISEFDILEEIPPEKRELMRDRERYWIKKLNSSKREFGYNLSCGGDGADFGANNVSAKFSEEQIQKIYYDLENSDLSITNLAEKYGVGLSTLSAINNGNTYYHTEVKYPIRKSRPSTTGIKHRLSKISEETLTKIIDSLKNEQDLTMRDIAKIYNVTPTVIQNINLGKTYPNKDLNYPIRKPRTGSRKLNNDQVLEIIEMIKNNPKKSFIDIGFEFGVSSKSISDINVGTTYKQKNENYPIRKR